MAKSNPYPRISLVALGADGLMSAWLACSLVLRGNGWCAFAIGFLVSLSGAISLVGRPVSSLTAALASQGSLTGHLQSLVVLELGRGWLSLGVVGVPHFLSAWPRLVAFSPPSCAASADHGPVGFQACWCTGLATTAFVPICG